MRRLICAISTAVLLAGCTTAKIETACSNASKVLSAANVAVVASQCEAKDSAACREALKARQLAQSIYDIYCLSNDGRI